MYTPLRETLIFLYFSPATTRLIMNTPTDELRYITSIPADYTPHLYKPRHRLAHFLKGKHIINLSDYSPSPVEIELLALNLSFVRDQNISGTETNTIIQHYVEKIDRLIFFSINPYKQPHGRINQLLRQPWVAPPQDWISVPRALTILKKLSSTIYNPDAPDSSFPKPLDDAILSLRTNDQIYITKADKGGATVIWDRSSYRREAYRQLSDNTTYEEIPAEQLPNIIKLLEDKKTELAEWLYALKRITNRERNLIIRAPSSIPPIYFLPKIHKKINPVSRTFPGRPIVATFNCHLHWLDKYITEVTNELHQLIPHALIDSLHLLDKLQNRTEPLPDDMRILSADVEALYPSIDWNRGIEAATNTFTRFYSDLIRIAKEKNQVIPPTPAMFRTLLSAILTNSYMHFQNEKFYHQLKGTAMGMCISVFFARAFMYEIIQPICTNPPSHLHLLEIFIDDIIISSTGSDDEINALIQSISDNDIKYTYAPASKQCIMLDLQITISDRLYITTHYCKPTARPFYLHAASMHPKSTIESIPYAQLLRIRRNSTYLADFIEPAQKLLRTLRLRGYPAKTLSDAFDKAIIIPRPELMKRKNVHNMALASPNTEHPPKKNFGSGIKLILPFCSKTNYNLVRSSLNDLRELIQTHYIDHPSITTQPNFEPILIHSKMRPLSASFSSSAKQGDFHP